MQAQQGGGDLTFTILKYDLVFITWPICGPFAKALWEEFRDAMRWEGGFLKSPPTAAQRKALEAELEREEPRQVHELLAHYKERRRSTSSPTRAQPGGSAPASTPTRRRRGFQ